MLKNLAGGINKLLKLLQIAVGGTCLAIYAVVWLSIDTLALLLTGQRTGSGLSTSSIGPDLLSDAAVLVTSPPETAFSGSLSSRLEELHTYISSLRATSPNIGSQRHGLNQLDIATAHISSLVQIFKSLGLVEMEPELTLRNTPEKTSKNPCRICQFIRKSAFFQK